MAKKALQTPDELMAVNDYPLKAEVEALRTIIKNANSKIAERVKWNAPSYYYIEDFAAFNLRQTKFVQLILIFPKGLLKDDYGILLGDWKDRREARFENMADVEAKKSALENVVNDWVELIDKYNS